MTKGSLACELKRSGQCNCSQAMVCAFEEFTDIPQEVAMHCTAAFGGGMGNMSGTCGALVGAGVVLSLYHKGDKKKSMMAMRRIMDQFVARNGTSVCKQLKVAKSCDECILEAAEYLEKELLESPRTLPGN